MSDRFHGGIKRGSLGVTIPVVLLNSSTGGPLTGVGSSTTTGNSISGLNVGIWRQGETSVILNPTKLGSMSDAWTSGGWREVQFSAEHPGLYRLDLPDAYVADGADWVFLTVTFTGATPYRVHYALEGHINSPGVETLLVRLTALRAANLDNLGGSGVNDLLARLTVERAAKLDLIGGDSLGVVELLARLTEQRAANLDNLDAAPASATALAEANAVLAKLDTMLAAAGDDWQFTAEALSEAPATDLSALIDDLWGAAASGHTAPGTMGGLVQSASLAANPWLATGLETYAPGTAGHKLATRLSVGRFLRGT